MQADSKPRALPLAQPERPTVFVGDGADPMREQLIGALGHLVLALPGQVAELAAAALRSQFGEGFPLLADADLTIRCDGEVFAPSPAARLLVEAGYEWLAEIAVLVLEFNEGLSNRNTARSRQQLYEDFRKLRIIFAREVEVEVGGRAGELPAVNNQVLAVPHPSYPTLVVEAAGDGLAWPLLARISRALPLALGRPSLAMPFRVAFLEIASAQKAFEGLVRPSDETIAEALGHPLARVQEIYRSLRSTTQRLFESLVPAARAMLGPDASAALLAREHLLVEDAQILALLLAQGADQALAARLLEVCRATDTLDEARRALGLDLAAFNQALAALGAPWTPLRFEARLRAQFDKHKEGRRAELELRVRDAYVAAFDAGADLADYRRRRGLEDIVFDEAWADAFDTMPEAVIDAAIATALATLPASATAADGPLETVRQANRAVLMAAIPALRRLVVAWADKPAQPERSAPPAWKGAQEEILRAVVGSGALDFRVLDEARLPAALRHAGLWPATMPVTRDLLALGLTEEDLEVRTQAEQEAQAKLEKARRTITFGGTEVDGGEERPLHKVAEALAAGLASKGFASRSGKAVLTPFADPSGTSGSRGKGGRKRDRDPEYLSSEQRTLLGFAGEYAAFLYLKRTVRNVSDAHWVSAMGRRFLGLPPGGDDEGYDFHVPRSRGPDLFFEVKGHRGDPGTVDLERSQVSAALRMADGRQGIWSILYVAYVESPDLIAVHELPNPYAEAGKRLFRELGKGSVRLEVRRD